MYNLEIKF